MPLILVAAALLVVVSGYLFVMRPADPRPVAGAPSPATAGPTATPPPTATPSPTPPPVPPQVKIEQATCCDQTARFLRATWTSSDTVLAAQLTLTPEPGFACSAAVGASGRAGELGCTGLLKGGTDHVATLTLRTQAGQFPFEHRFKTMGDRLTGVQWYTEFEDTHAAPLACAAASIRIVQHYTTGQDKLTAEQILRQGQPQNRSRDPGLDPVAIASMQKSLDSRNNYHYYRFDSKEVATLAATYWLLRSGKPVHAITLAGQHDPLVIGFEGVFGASITDPVNRITGVVVQDPQRGDMRPETRNRRPDKYRTPAFQTGHTLDMGEWYRDEWWMGFPYAGALEGVSIDRSDGAYPLPHWAGKFVIIVDDGDAEHPPDREGRVPFR